MNPSELRNQSDADLAKELIALRREQFNLRMQAATGALAGSHQVRAARRNIARIKTLQRERLGAQTKGGQA